MPLPTVAGTLQVSPPAFIRKLRRRGDWGEPGDDPDQRAKLVVERLFRSQAEREISVFLVNDDEDLRRVALGINTGRASLSEAVPLVAFLPSELAEVAIQPKCSPGMFPCTHANNLHHDIQASDDQLSRLCLVAFQQGRVVGNCSQGMMKETITEAMRENCRSVSTIGNCHVENCDSGGDIPPATGPST